MAGGGSSELKETVLWTNPNPTNADDGGVKYTMSNAEYTQFIQDEVWFGVYFKEHAEDSNRIGFIKTRFSDMVQDAAETNKRCLAITRPDYNTDANILCRGIVIYTNGSIRTTTCGWIDQVSTARKTCIVTKFVFLS